MGRIILSIVGALAMVTAACGGAATGTEESSNVPSDKANPAAPAAPAPACGGTDATLTPSGNTYDDSNPGKGSSPISFTMYVYQRTPGAAAPDAVDTATGEQPRSCPSANRVVTSSSVVTLPIGQYYACRDAPGLCRCIALNLTGGPATFVWGAGPGGGHLEASGCLGAN